MVARSLFVTGTDTGVGKTTVALALIQHLQQQGQRVVGFKPVASGAAFTPAGWRNADALALQVASSLPLPYPAINPYVFAPPIAPHLAAVAEGVTLDWAVIQAAHQQITLQADWVVIEGAGGWLVPWDAQRTVGDCVAQAGWPVILVVGLRLGCLNHALLTAEAIQRRGAQLLGWVANELSPEIPAPAGQLATLQVLLPAPMLAYVRYGDATSVWNWHPLAR